MICLNVKSFFLLDCSKHQGCTDIWSFRGDPKNDVPVFSAELPVYSCVDHCRQIGQKYAAVSMQIEYADLV